MPSTRSVCPFAVTILFAVFVASLSVAQSSGQATGSFSVDGKAYKLTNAAAFVDQEDARKPVILVLSDQALATDKWTSESNLDDQRRDRPFNGVAFWLDQKREVFRTDYFLAGKFPTSTSNIFELKLNGASGKTLSGSARATDEAVKSHKIRLEATFSATLK